MEVKLVEMKMCNTEIPKEYHQFDVITDVESQTSFIRKDCFEKILEKFLRVQQSLWMEYPKNIPKAKGRYLCIIEMPTEISDERFKQEVMRFDSGECYGRSGRWFGRIEGRSKVTHFTELIYPESVT
jgi:hypothetical protein